MSGEAVPYQLRPNKYVERQLFLELIDILFDFLGSREYCYISMGGRFLQDLRAIHVKLGLKNLISIESDKTTYQRQLFNKPFSIIRCENKSSSKMIADFSEYEKDFKDQGFLIWLDYASAADRGQQLKEFSELINKLSPNDIVKITMNISLHSLGIEKDNDESPADLQKQRLDRLTSQMEDFISEVYRDPSFMTDDGFRAIVLEAIEKAASEGLQSRPDLVAEPLAIFTYQDGNHRMLTLTCILLEKNKVISFREKINQHPWGFFTGNWKDGQEIAVPDLSAKERYKIHESLLSEESTEIIKNLGFKLHRRDKDSVKIINQYALHYKRYPSFVRIDE
jgi:hypothetical protein